MSVGAPPLRFLLVVVGGWICVRSALLATGGSLPPPPARDPGTKIAADVSRPAAAGPPTPPAVPVPAWSYAEVPSRTIVYAPPLRVYRVAASSVRAAAARPPQVQVQVRHNLPVVNPATPSAIATQGAAMAASQPFILPPPAAPRQGRWSGSGWLHVRRGGSEPLAAGGTLGGSQFGMRINYRLNGDAARPLSLSARVYVPLNRIEGAEVAAGVDWRPIAAVPIHLLAERRQRIGREGRSDFAVTAHGGVSDRPLPGGLRLDLYAQAGVVGLRSRDPFVDGAARISARAGPVDIGGGVWGAAQPGASRLDLGPQASVRLPIEGVNLRLFADWRFRVAGDAAPASGPTLTLGTDF